MSAELNELAERAAQLSGPDREVDRAIARIMGWHRVEPRHSRNKHGAWIAPEDFIGTYSDGSPRLDSLHGTDMHREVPAYTGSLNAAVTLYPSLPAMIPSDPRQATADALRIAMTQPKGSE